MAGENDTTLGAPDRAGVEALRQEAQTTSTVGMSSSNRLMFAGPAG